MVASSEIHAANAQLNQLESESNSVTGPATRVAVFVGGTSGIGKFTIRELVSSGAKSRIYLIGRRKSAESAQQFIQELSAINPQAEVIWTEAEVSLLAECKRVCELIKEREADAQIDLLFLSMGYAPFDGRKETSEGVDVVQSLEYYARILFIQHLLALLTRAQAPRVVSVLAGSLVTASIDLDDLDLRKPGNFGGPKAQKQFGNMGTSTLDKLAHDNPSIAFVHSWPGAVSTGNATRGVDPSSWLFWFMSRILEPLFKFFGISEHESGQRHLFQSTSAAFGGRGTPWKGRPEVNTRSKHNDNGLFLTSYNCNTNSHASAMTELREKAQAKIWDHTQKVLEPYL